MPTQLIAAGGLVTNPNGEILWIFRRGFWDLPKGKLDEGETIQSCAVREVQEETGLINIQLHQMIGFTNHTYFDKYLNEEVVKRPKNQGDIPPPAKALDQSDQERLPSKKFKRREKDGGPNAGWEAQGTANSQQCREHRKRKEMRSALPQKRPRV